MSPAVLFALSSLACAGLVDLSYKRYSLKPRSRGVFLAGMGLVWLGLQLVYFAAAGQSLVLDPLTLGYGVAAGVAVTASNLMLIECMTRLNVSLGSTIYRLNTIGVVLMSVAFLGEALPAPRLLGIAFGVVAVLFLYERHAPGSEHHQPAGYVALAVAAALCRASYGVVSKAGLAAGADPSGLLVTGAVCWVIGGIAYGLARERPLRVTVTKVGYAVVAGLFVFGTVNTLILGLSHGDATLVIPIANLGFVIAFTVGVLWRMERFTARKAAAMLIAALAIFLLSRTAS